MIAAPAPTARRSVGAVAVVLALGLVALGVVGVRELLVARGWAAGSSWTLEALRGLDGLTATSGVTVAAGGAVLLGLVLVVIAVLPARATHRSADGVLWFSAGALSALAAAVADRTPGVLAVDARRSGRRRIVLEVVSGARQDPEAVALAVRQAVDARLAGLPAPAVRVRVKAVA